MLAALVLSVGVLGIATTDTARAHHVGPTIARAQIGLVSIAPQPRAPVMVRQRLSGQAKGGLIGAVVGAAVSAGMVEMWRGHSELEGPSLVLTALGGAFAGFVIGVLVAGPS